MSDASSIKHHHSNLRFSSLQPHKRKHLRSFLLRALPSYIIAQMMYVSIHVSFLLHLLLIENVTAFSLSPCCSSTIIKNLSFSDRRTRKRRNQFSFFSLLSSSTTTPEQEESNKSAKKAKKWFPVKPEDALLTQYDTLVRGAYVRHVLLETEEMVDLAIQTYLRGGGDGFSHSDTSSESTDPFGKLAKDISACTKSRDENGKIGWIDNPFHPSKQSTQPNMINEVVGELISSSAIEELFQRKPKGGDVLKIKSSQSTSTEHGEISQRWHLCRVDDLLIDYIPNSSNDNLQNGDNENEIGNVMQFKQKGVNKVITSRSKLKGLGTTPTAPRISMSMSEDDTNTNNVAKTYHIATTGCQMNVADSERLAGVLENKLKLEQSTSPNNANVVILNTCSIRDHAEQKVYDTLGPYAARKRKGESIALIVAGCVAQQEGEALLKRVPEVDLVMGPQYVNRLDDLLDDVSRGHQVVATDPTLLSEDLSRPVRGHSMRAWVNVIHGCNEHCTYCVVSFYS